MNFVSKRLVPFFAVFTLVLFIVTSPSISAQGSDGDSFVRGRVVEVNQGEGIISSSGEMQTQIVTVQITSGSQKGEIVTITNALTGHPYYDLVVEKGNRVILESDSFEGIVGYHIADFDRQRPVAVTTALFLLSVLLIGGVKGAKAIVSLVVMGAAILYVILPLILRGFNPILITVGLCSVLTVLFLFFIGGFNRKTTAAVIGTVGGLVSAGLLALIAGKASFLTGLSSPEAQLLQFAESSIDYQGLLFSGMIIGALGAIFDVGMGVASSMEQIKEADPKTSFQLLVKRGLNVGRDMLGTMSNTLILAYVGSSLPLLLLFLTNDTPWIKIINLDMVATEIIRAMTGSIGLALSIPLTALSAGFLLLAPEQNRETKEDTQVLDR